MLYYDRTYVSERTDVNKTNKSHKRILFNYYFLLNSFMKEAPII